MFTDEKRNKKFLKLKANICDLNPAIVKKSVTGTEQDFIQLMDRAKSFVNTQFAEDSELEKKKILEMFRECVFGYYVLTPLIEDKAVSDIKVLDYNRVVIKVSGKRYVSEVSFFDESDYKDWYERILRINRIYSADSRALSHCTDRKGAKDYYLRLDAQSEKVTSTEKNNIHIRKMPKEKYSWEYLISNGMLDEDHLEYIKDRLDAGYGFLISGKGGSGKSTLLNNMIDLISYDESILVSQESDELYSNDHPQIQLEHTIEKEVSGEDKETGLEDELRLGLLQDIDNFVIGEIKGGEALFVFTTALSTGARFLGTLHSNDAASSVTRLAQCARYISDYSMEALMEMLAVMPLSLIHMSSFSIDEILEIDGFDYEQNKLKFREVYKKESK